MLKVFDIEKLEVGMYVDSIDKQIGQVEIKTRGRITSQATLESLKNKGIKRVIVDLSKQPKEAPPELSQEPEQVKATFEGEIAIAAKLYQQGKVLQKDMLNRVAKSLPIDIVISEKFTDNLVSSIDRNPNALLCMSKIREKDSYLLEHSLNVAILLANFANQLEMDEEKVQELALSGFLHDIGKINVPDEILHKPGRLTDVEMDVMRKHVQYGTDVLLDMNISPSIIRTIREHHERLDGFGYPEGKQGEEISLFGRMIAIADTYDAITADRCYKAGMSSKKALQILIKDSPVKYDKELVMQFVKSIGIYPVGSLVKLSNDKVAMVLKQNPQDSNKPVVKVFYSTTGNHYVKQVDIDLANLRKQIKIVEAVIASDYKLDFNRFFNESVAV